MSVLEQMRSGSDSTFMQVVMALVVVSFVFWYAAPMGDKSSVVATVNGTRIMDTDFRRLYRDQERRRESTFGRVLSDPEKTQLREEVKKQLVENEVLEQEAGRLGLEVSDTEVARALLDIDGFRNEDGAFDVDLYERWLKRNRYTRADFEERMRTDILLNKLRQLVYMGATISEPVLKQAYIDQNTRVDLQYVRVRSSAFYKSLEIADADLDEWLVANEDKAKTIYERDLDRVYTHPDTAKLKVIRLAIRDDGEGAAQLLPRLNAIKAEVEAGADFGELARKWSEDPSAAVGGDLGVRPVKQLPRDDQDAIKAAEVGSLTRIVPSDKELKLYQVLNKTQGYVDTFEDSKRKIADQALREERAPARAASFAEDELMKQWTDSGDVPNDLLRGVGLAATSTGLVPARPQSPLDPPKKMFDDSRTATVGNVFPEVYEDKGILYVGKLNNREEPDMDLFEDERDQIREQVLSQRRFEFYKAWVDAATARATITM